MVALGDVPTATRWAASITEQVIRRALNDPLVARRLGLRRPEP